MSLLLIIPLFFSLKSAYQFGQNWLYLIPNSPDLWEIARSAKADSTQWVSVLEGEHFWNIAAFDTGLKLSNAYSAQEWKNRIIPPAHMEITPAVIALENTDLVFSTPEINVLRHPGVAYAYILAGESRTECRANATGGSIDVTCPESSEGTLMVMEYNWQGWSAWRDEASTPLLDSQWLSVTAPAGVHNYYFRYRPWDVWVGFGFTLLGIAGCIFFWRKASK